MTTSADVALLQDQETIAATPAAVWALVGDPTRMSEWSPQVDSTRLADGATTCALGTRFTNRNVQGDLAWITHGEVVHHEPGRALAFRIEENWAVSVLRAGAHRRRRHGAAPAP